MEIVLASRSPRRRELMAKVAPEFSVCPSGVREEEIGETDPLLFAVAAAEKKARDVAESHPEALVIGADTVVALGGRILGKPRDLAEGREMLRALSGSRHRVITGVALFRKSDGRLATGYEITRVVFRRLEDAEIEEYLAKNEFLDKAGSYAVQEVGDRFVKRIAGDYENIVGFPVGRVKRLMKKFFAPEFDVEIVDAALPNDWGVARKDGMILFVPGATPGDVVRVRVARTGKTFSFAEVLGIERPSPHRVEPRCPHVGVCGGCAFQHLSGEKQRDLKREHLFQSLVKIGGADPAGLADLAVRPSPDEYGYRNKMEFAFGERDGRLVLGLRERVSPLQRGRSAVVPLETCPIFGGIPARLFPVVLGYGAERGWTAYDSSRHMGFARHLVLREGKNTGEAMAVLVTTGSALPDLAGLADAMRAAVPELVSVWWVGNNALSDAVVFERRELLSGAPHIGERVGSCAFRIRPETFFQPNTRGAELLYSRIAGLLPDAAGKRLLGLYCGSGAIEVSVAGVFSRATGVDIVAANVEAARENAALNGRANCEFVESDAEDYLKANAGGADVVLVDPPRGGMTPKALKRVAEYGAPEMIYVSCNPATLARDLAVLRAAGLGIVSIEAFDLFPHTAHLETLVLLRRGGG